MRVPLSWLREYVDVDLDAEQLAERLTLLGMEVKGIIPWGADWQHVVVGELLEVKPHPRADRLSLTRVRLGGGETLDIVCGATNIAPGQRIPVALPGAVLPGDRRIERTEKMGVVSNGMLCSGDELHLTGDSDGILILPADTPLGRPLVELYGDTVLDIDVKPNRGDALSILGIAREVAAVTGGPLRWPIFEVPESDAEVASRLRVRIEDPTLCPRFVGRRVTGVRVAPSPDAVQMRLLAAGFRPISNVVDASNYVMVEMGKPIHTFDAAAVADGEIIVRTAEPGERLETLDHVIRDLRPESLLIADRNGPLALAGVMGGAASEVSDQTTDVIVESAVFDPVSIRRTAFRYALRSEASLRFEKGQESRLARIGADRTAELIVAWAGGLADRGRVDTAPEEPEASRVAFRPARVNRLLGTALTTEEQQELLARAGIETRPATVGSLVPLARGSMPLDAVAGAGEAWEAIVPTWRRDITIEADVTEEIVRLHGFERVPEILPHTSMPAHRPNPLALRDRVRELLAGAGLTEVVNHALVAPRLVELTAWQTEDGEVPGEGPAGGPLIRVENPLSADHSVLRQGLLGGLLDVVSVNLRHQLDDIAIFEVGKGYARDGGDAHEWWRLGLAMTGSADAPAWNRPARPADLDDIKGICELLCAQLGFGAPLYQALPGEPVLHPGRSARIEARGPGGDLQLSGRVGEVHPGIVEASEIRSGRVIVAELALHGLAGGDLPMVRSVPPPRHPLVERDIALVLSAATPIAAVSARIRESGGPLLASVELFDLYRGAPLADGERSLAFRVIFSAPDRTLAEAEVDDAVASIVAGVASSFGGRLRT